MVVTGEHDSPPFHQQAGHYSAALAAAGLTVLRTVEKDEDHFRSVRASKIIFVSYYLRKGCKKKIVTFFRKGGGWQPQSSQF